MTVWVAPLPELPLFVEEGNVIWPIEADAMHCWTQLL